MKRRVALFLCVLTLLGCLLFAGVAHAKRELPTAEGVLSALYEADISTLRQAIDSGLISCEELSNLIDPVTENGKRLVEKLADLLSGKPMGKDTQEAAGEENPT